MMDIYDEFVRIITRFEADDITYAVCGGFAVVVHGFTRVTEDIDLLVSPSEVARARASAKAAGFGLAALPMRLPASDGSLTEVHRISRIEGIEHLMVDLIVAGPGLEDVLAGRQAFSWMGHRLHVVSRGGLLIMKRRAGRTKDLLDIEELGLEDGP